MNIAMQKFLRSGLRMFMKKEDGLVTVEWVALASAVVIGGIVLAYAVMQSLVPTAKGIGNGITSANNSGATALNAAIASS